jgi:NAD(P)H-nitrite reductase large subunit
MNDPTICRCEGVTLRQIENCLTVPDTSVSLRELKLQTRAGMGICQGRTCMPLLTAIADASGRGLSNDAGLASNQPIRPIAIADLMNFASEPERRVAE